MTEKDFRKLVTDLELTKLDKEEIDNLRLKLLDILKKDIKHFEIDDLVNALSLKWGVSYHNEKEVSFTLIVKNVKINNFPLTNQSLINEVFNALLYNLNIDKKDNIGYDEVRNAVYVISDGLKINILLRYNEEINYQTEYFLVNDDLKHKFINLAASDFNLFKNTVILIKYLANDSMVDISTYMISLLLYYGLSENFTTHTYEAYLKEFNHSIDDYLKGIKIDQDDDTYRRLEVERINQPKKMYTIVDIANPKINLTANAGEAFSQDLRKLKKSIQKVLENH